MASKAGIHSTFQLVGSIGALLLISCSGGDCAVRGRSSGSSTERLGTGTVVLASTTSTDDTGLFSALLPVFEAAHPGLKVSVVAVGTGQAIALGRSRDADVLLVHSRAAEDRFMAEGHGLERRDVMYNDFVLVGPATDPAALGRSADVIEALRAISNDARFVSRGDDSGTHMKEMELIAAADLAPSGDWRLSIGQGMGEALIMTSELQAYTLSDRGTFLAMQLLLDLEILFQGDDRLHNPYGVILVEGTNNPEWGKALVDWLVSSEAREIIRTFGTERFGEPLFFPVGAESE